MVLVSSWLPEAGVCCGGALHALKDELCCVSGLQDTAATCKPAPVPSWDWQLSKGVLCEQSTGDCPQQDRLPAEPGGVTTESQNHGVTEPWGTEWAGWVGASQITPFQNSCHGHPLDQGMFWD